MENHKNIQKKIQEIIEERYAAVGEKLVPLKSPIERMMLFALEERKQCYPHIAVTFLSRPQVKTSNQNFDYREPDILATVTLPDGSERNFDIECDDFEYHSFENKEDMNKQYNRTYELEELGYHVIRFSGSDINREPLKYADQFYRIVEAQC